MRNWNLGYALTWGKRLYVGFITLLAVFLAYAVALRKPEKVCAQTVIIDNGRVQLAHCDPFSSLQTPVVEHLLGRVATNLYTYEKERPIPYAQKHVEDAPYIEANSAAARIFKKDFEEVAGREEGPISQESSKFTVDLDSFRFSETNSERRMGQRWLVTFTGKRCLSQVQGNVEKLYKFTATVVEGDYNAIYKISDLSYSSANSDKSGCS